MLLIGTENGVYRASVDILADATLVHEVKNVHQLRRFGGTVFAATSSGLFRSDDGGTTWRDLDVPQDEVFSVLESPDREYLYAGTHPAHLYISTDDGESWSERESLLEQPSYESWPTPRHSGEAHVVSLGSHPDVPERVIVGIEVGGVHVSEDNGQTWAERKDGVDDDIHHILIRSAEEYIASTGGGLFRTRDAGRSWTQLDTEIEQFYFRNSFAAGGRLYTAGSHLAPLEWTGETGQDAVLFESTDGGDNLEAVPYPDVPTWLITAWTALENNESDVLAGTYTGNIFRRMNDEWTIVGDVPGNILSFSTI